MCNLYSRESYWAKMGNQRFLHYGEKERLEKFGTQFNPRLGGCTDCSQRSVINIVVDGIQV